jgi:hypothetical protein
MNPYDEKLEGSKMVKKVLDKYIYLTEKIRDEVIHADTLMLYRKVEIELKKELVSLQEILNK